MTTLAVGVRLWQNALRWQLNDVSASESSLNWNDTRQRIAVGVRLQPKALRWQQNSQDSGNP